MNRFAILFVGLVCASSAISQSAEIKFKVVPDFIEKTPGGEALGACHGAALVDKAGNFYITTDTKRGIVVFSPEGKFLKTVGPTQIHGAEIRDENGTEFIYAARPN